MFWVRHYILFHSNRHPSELGKSDLEKFLNFLASTRHVSASTQSQALNALIFMYREILKIEPGRLDGLRCVNRGTQLPVILSQRKVALILDSMIGTPKLMAQLLYGAGLRVTECVSLRIKDIDFDGRTIVVRAGKGNKDRVTILPRCIERTLSAHIVGYNPTKVQKVAPHLTVVPAPLLDETFERM